MVVVTALQLKSFFVFNEISHADLDFLGKHARILRSLPGEKIFEEGEPSNDLYLIIQGKVKVRKSSGEKVTEVAELTAGALFGETAFLEQGIHSASIVAVEPTALVLIPMSAIDDRIAANPTFGHMFYRALCLLLSKRIRLTNIRLAALVTGK